VLNEIYQIWLYRKLIRRYRDHEVVNFDFTGYFIHYFFSRVTYYCNDNFTSISRKLNIWPIYKYHSFCETKLAQKARLCIGTSGIIRNHLLKMNARSFEIPLGGPDIKEFNIKPGSKNSDGERMNIGLVGFIKSFNLSVELLNLILSQIDCTITLIGPLDPEFYRQITKKESVKYKGVLTGLELLNEVNLFDVAIAPYDNRIFEEGGLPNKLFIYLSLGKPVVLTDLLSLKELDLPDRLIYTVSNNIDFSPMIQKAHNENNALLIDQRVKYAQQHTWEKRIDRFMEVFV